MSVTDDKLRNIKHAKSFLEAAKASGSELVILPECWNSPYSTAAFPKYAEKVPPILGLVHNKDESPSTDMLCEQAKLLNIWIVGGSIPERETTEGTEKLYNTWFVR